MAAAVLAGHLGPAVGAPEQAVITTIAGEGVGHTPYGLGADLSGPRTAAVDNAGMIWFTDTGHHQIKRLDPATGLITVVAGTGLAGALGDGRAAVSASLDMPHGIAVDNRGGIYIADSANNRIRMVNQFTGLITTVAGTGRPGFRGEGGLATAADLDHPRFLVATPDGGLIIADTGNHRIRRVDPRGVISTIAGTGRPGYSGDGGPAIAADLDDPRGLALAPDGTSTWWEANACRCRPCAGSTQPRHRGHPERPAPARPVQPPGVTAPGDRRAHTGAAGAAGRARRGPARRTGRHGTAGERAPDPSDRSVARQLPAGRLRRRDLRLR